MFAMFLSLLAVNVERYIAIAYPLRYPVIVSEKGARITVVCFWAGSVAILMLTWVESPWQPFPDNVAQVCFLWKYYSTVSLHLHMFYIFYIPFAVTIAIFVLFAMMLVIAHKHSKKIIAIQAHGNGPGHGRHRDTRTATTFFLMAMSQAIANLPWLIVICIGDVPEVVIFIAEVLFASSGWWDVVVYYVRNRAFRESAKNFSKGCKTCNFLICTFKATFRELSLPYDTVSHTCFNYQFNTHVHYVYYVITSPYNVSARNCIFTSGEANILPTLK
ncbi:uncharacterized protein [Amphiura filiformis]|uniref:uncharacterized protein n=1 Tax=Amphiura filiformis TaxID=82378 RepID=UPI003B223B45